jgi:ABC-2 type transport system ATP-binding protein
MLTVEKLTKKFGEKLAVNQISFTVKPGVITGLLGPNGAGKTTTMRLLTGFLSPTSGTVTYGNFSIDSDLKEIQSRLGYLPESAALYPELLVLEFLEYIARVRGVEESEISKKVNRMIDLCELSTHLKVPISFLSKGFKQRVALAGTLVHDPELIILDEPTSGLDPNQISHIRTLIQSLSQNRTLILSTHILQEVEDICDEVIIMSGGSLVANSSVKGLDRGNSISVSIRGAEKAISSFFNSQFSGAEKLETTVETDGFVTYLVPLGDQKTEKVFSVLKGTDFEVREIKVVKKSLESIFEELTRGKQ